MKAPDKDAQPRRSTKCYTGKKFLRNLPNKNDPIPNPAKENRSPSTGAILPKDKRAIYDHFLEATAWAVAPWLIGFRKTWNAISRRIPYPTKFNFLHFSGLLF
jgi:hypothetical protein